MWRKIQIWFGGVWGIIVTIPTAIALARGFTLAFGQGTREFGMVMDDTVSLFMFWTFASGVGLGFIALIIMTMYEKLTGQKIFKSSDKQTTNSTLTKPDFNIQIKSSDVRYMDSRQIREFFKGTKQSLVEYRRVLSETRKHKQNDGEYAGVKR